MENITQFLCPDCCSRIELDLGVSPSLCMVSFAGKIRCDTCSSLRDQYRRARDCAEKAMNNSSFLAEEIKRQTKDEAGLIPSERSSLWHNTQKLEENMEVLRDKRRKMQQISAAFTLRTGLKII